MRDRGWRSRAPAHVRLRARETCRLHGADRTGDVLPAARMRLRTKETPAPCEKRDPGRDVGIALCRTGGESAAISAIRGAGIAAVFVRRRPCRGEQWVHRV